MNERETHQLPGSSSRTTADAEPRGVPSVAAIATQTAREIYATLVEQRRLLRPPQHTRRLAAVSGSALTAAPDQPPSASAAALADGASRVHGAAPGSRAP